jgi:hypothetical protein
MIHPNTVAIDTSGIFSVIPTLPMPPCKSSKTGNYPAGAGASPDQPKYRRNSRFIEQIRTYISEMEKQYAFLNFQEEKERLRTFSDPGKPFEVQCHLLHIP